MTDPYDLPEVDKPKTIWPYLLAGLGIFSLCSLIGGVLLLTYGVSTIGTRFSTEAAPFVATAQFATTQVAVTQTSSAASLVSANATTTQAAAATPFLQNDFDLNTGDWLVGKDTDPQRGSINRRVGEGKYTWKLEPTDGVIWYSYPDVARTTDLLAQVEVEKISGSNESTFGLILRLTNSGSYYYFYLAPAGQYFGVSLYHQQQWQRLVGGTYSPAINTSGSNKLAVLASGPNFSLYINDVFVGSFSESTLAGGRVGLAVEVFDAGEDVEVEFDNFVLWNSDVVSPRGTASVVATYTARPLNTSTPFAVLMPFELSGQIAYQTSGRLFIMNADGSYLRTPDYYDENGELFRDLYSPEFSPDGEQIVFEQAGELYLVAAPFSKFVQLDLPGVRHSDPSWSPDAREIVYAAIDDSEGSQTDLYIFNFETKETRRLTNSKSIETDPVWSPDGQQIAFVDIESGDYQIKIINADGSGLHTLSDGTAKDRDPSWSPDGNWIAFTSSRDRNNEIYQVHPDGSELTNLTNDPANDFGPAWSPDGEFLAFLSNRYGLIEILVMNADGTKAYQITLNSLPEYDLDWGP